MQSTPPDPRSPPRPSKIRRQIDINLAQGFKFLHEPVRSEENPRFAGRIAEIQDLVDRIRYSDGGSFLITGYRGVGKTSFVNQALLSLGKNCHLLDIYINLARPLTEAELMHLIIRRLYDRLVEKDWYCLLDPELQRQITLAYHRTSANVVRKSSQSWERSMEFGFSAPPGIKLPFAPKFANKGSRSIDLETSFLAYDDKAAEHDVITIARTLTRTPFQNRKGLRNLIRRLQGIAPAPDSMKIIFVFDEMDKLDDNPAAVDLKSEVEKMLSGLKNLFTTSGICFLFVAGKDLHERWLKDLWSGDSIYESVFSYDKYLPCMWADVDSLCANLAVFAGGTKKGELSQEELVFENFKDYLRFRGRGIPRRILRAFNEQVSWRSDSAYLAFPNEQLRRVNFYAQLNQLLELNSDRLFGRAAEDTVGTRYDRVKLGILYVVDWILRQGRLEFAASDVLTASRELSSRVALAEQMAVGSTLDLLDVLVKGEYIQAVVKKLDQVALDQGDQPSEKRYHITERRLAEMAGILMSLDEPAPNFEDSEAFRGAAGRRIAHYELHELLGQGGMGLVYHAWDTAARRFVALKILHSSLTNSSNAQTRFRRELATLQSLKHPNIVTFLESGEDDSQIYLAMEFIEGIDLDTVLAGTQFLGPELAMDVLLPIADAIEFAHSKGFVRLDIKSNNIRLSTSGRAYLMDLGIAKHQEQDKDKRITSEVNFVGTPSYLAPEQLTRGALDKRTDIYSFGVVLYETLTGHLPFTGEDAFEVGMKHLKEDPAPPSSLVPLPVELEAAVLRCLEKSPDSRFPNMAEVKRSLKPFVGSSWQSNLVSLVKNAKQEAQRTDKQNREATLIGDVVSRPDLSVTSELEFKTIIRRDLAESYPASNLPWIELSQGKSPAQHHPLSKEITTIGRDPTNDICLHSPSFSCSRFQARICAEKGGHVLTDLNSSNGTYLNGQRVLRPMPLLEKDHIEIGEAHLTFHASLTA